MLPDLSTVSFHGIDGRSLLMGGLVVCAARAAVRPDGLQSAQEPARARVDARGVRADLRDVQDLPDHAGQVHPDSVGVHRRCCRAVLRPPRDHRRCRRRCGPRLPDLDGRHHSDLQPDRHRGQLRRGVVRHPGQHVRQLARRVREPAREAVSDLRDSAARRDEHRHAAHQRRAVPDALHPAVHPGQLRRGLFHRLRDWRVARRRGAPHRGRHLHQDRGHRLGPDEDRLQHQGRRRA